MKGKEKKREIVRDFDRGREKARQTRRWRCVWQGSYFQSI